MGKDLARFVARKAKEPSTWKGLGWVLVAAGLVPVGSVDLVVSVGVGLVGLVDIIRKETDIIRKETDIIRKETK